MVETLLTVTQAAELLEISERSVQRNAMSGKYGELRYAASANGGGTNGKTLRVSLIGLPVEAREKYLAAQGTGNTPIHVTADAYDLSPAWQREKAQKRREILKAYEEYLHRPGKKTELTEAFITAWNAAHPDDTVTTSTIYNYRRDYQKHGLAGLLPSYGTRRGQRSIDDEALREFYALYLDDSRPSVADVYFSLELLAKKNNWKIPSLKTMQRMAKKDIPAEIKTLLRKGEKAYIDNIQTFTRRDPESVKSGEVFVGDHYRFDFFILGPNGQWVRPWLTAWMDMRSRKLVGWQISFSPCTDVIIAAFAEAALDLAIGLPRDIYIDNGQDYCAYRFAGRGFRGKKLTDNDKEVLKQEGKIVESLMDKLKIKVHSAIVENARAKVIEREFKNIVEWFSKHIETYCGRNKDERPESLKQKLKNKTKYGLTMPQLQQLFGDWARLVFNKRKSQKGKGREGECPDETFSRTRLPVRAADLGALQLLFMKQSKVFKIGRNGVTFRGREYYFADEGLHKKKNVYIRYREEDLSKIWLYDLDDRQLGTATILESIAGINACPDKIKAEYERKKAEKQAVTLHPIYQAAKSGSQAGTVENVIELQKLYGDSAPDPERTKVVEMVTVSGNLRESARMLKATGTDNKTAINVFEAMSRNKFEGRKGD